MKKEDEDLLMVKSYLQDLPEPERVQVLELAEQLQDQVRDHPRIGELALCLVGAEPAAQTVR